MAGEVRITRRRENRMVAEDLLDFEEIDALFDQVRGVAVAQAVRGDLFFNPHSVATWRKVLCTPPRSSGEVAWAAPLRPA